jgi:hypothetical protein
MPEAGGRRAGRSAIVYVCAVAIVALSFVPYATSHFSPRGRWQAGNYDPADYRYVAEYFWGVPIVPDTYDGIWQGPWGTYLQTVPFRTIGLGTLYLGVGWLRLGHAPRTVDEIETAGAALASLEKVLLAAALLTVFAVIARQWGIVVAFIALTLLAFPTVQWRISDDFLSEPAHRIIFLFMLAATIAMRGRSTLRLVWLLPVLWLLTTQIKVQWYVGAVALVPVVLFQFWRMRVSPTAAVAFTAAMIAVPLSVVAVNWIGWRTAALSPGVGFHINLRHDGAVLREYAQAMADDPSRPTFAEPGRDELRWWNVYIDPAATKEQYAAFDRFAQGYLRRHVSAACRFFADGLAAAATFPGVERVRADGRIRIEPIPQPWHAFQRVADVFVWLLLFVGLVFDDTRLPSALALILWIVPAIGNVVSPYEIRYHLPMAGIAATVAAIVATRLATLKMPVMSEHAGLES